MKQGTHKNMSFFASRTIFSAVFIFILAAFFLIPSNSAHAILGAGAPTGVFVPSGDIVNTAAIHTTAANEVAQSTKEYTLDYAVNLAAKLMLRSVTNSVVSWINSGFEGSPAFVTDPAGMLQDVGDQIAGDFIAGTELGFLCEPFSLDIRLALNLGYSADFVEKNYCRLTGVIANTENFAKYTSGDFSQGGWDSWIQISQNPSNNPLSAFLEAKNELAIRTASGRELEIMKWDWGEGFLSWQECIREDRDGNCIEKGPIETPGSVIEKQLNDAVGSGARQLEVADEVNEIVSALVGQLVQTVFTQGLASFGPGGSNSDSLSVPLSVSCAPNRSSAAIGENVRWNASVFGGSGGGLTTYTWSGDESLSGSTATVNMTYSTEGTKTASVRVTKGGESVLQYCGANVTIQDAPLSTGGLDVVCSPDRSSAALGDTVRWTATPISAGGESGVVTYNWTGVGPIAGATTADVDVMYQDPGTKTARVTITRNGQTASRSCVQSVDVPDPVYTVSCTPDRTSVQIGDTVNWRSTITGMGPGQAQPVFAWNGSAPVASSTTQIATVRYTTSGIKTADVTVSRYSQSVNAVCQRTVRVRP